MGRAVQRADGRDLRALNDSIGFDQRMYGQDIRGSIAYARAIAGAGVITEPEAEVLVDGLSKCWTNSRPGRLSSSRRRRYSHGGRAAADRTGRRGRWQAAYRTQSQRSDRYRFSPVGDGRDRRIPALLVETRARCVDQAETHAATLMPGYTHVQPAQPITAAHWLMSFFWMLARDVDRLGMPAAA